MYDFLTCLHTSTHSLQVEGCKKLVAQILIEGHNVGEAKDIAQNLAKKEDLTYVHGYNDPSILAGQGTVALEIMEQMREEDVECDAVVIPTGGGGLIAGMAVAFKYFQPRVEVIVSAFLTIIIKN